MKAYAFDGYTLMLEDDANVYYVRGRASDGPAVELTAPGDIVSFTEGGRVLRGQEPAENFVSVSLEGNRL